MFNYTPIKWGERIVGVVKGDIFEKRVSANKHFLKIPPAIAFNICTLDDAKRAGASLVSVTDNDTSRTYKATIQKIYEKGWCIDRGFGAQIALTLEHWEVEGQPRQLGFWGNENAGNAFQS